MTSFLVIGNYNYSSWSLRAWLVARWSGLVFEERRVALDTEGFAEEVRDLSPSGLVPVLHHEGNVVWDSLAIAEYLAECFPQAALWPPAKKTRAMARALAAEMHGGFTSLRQQMPMNCRASGRRVAADAALRNDIQRIIRAWSEALAHSGGPCLYGDCCITDAMFAPVLFRFATYGVALPESLSAYSEHMLDMPELRLWHARACEEKEIIQADETGQV